jgi:hypothetical protein
MSRAMNVSLPEEDVLAKCRDARVSVSTSEPLPDGGTHLVTTTGEGAETMRVKFRKNLMTGTVRRLPFFSRPAPC